MVKDYIVNSVMLIAFVSIAYQFFMNSELKPSLSIVAKISSGIIFGFLGIGLMVFGIRLPNNLVVDFRNLSILLSSISGGWISAITSTFTIATYRLFFYGINKPSIIAISVTIILVVIFNIITKLNIKRWLKWLLSVGISEIISSVAFTILIDDIRFRYDIITSYCISLSLISFSLYFYVKYIESITESYKTYKQEANKDFLTGLNNVRQFGKLYNEVMDSIEVKYDMISLLYIDIDFFKKVNDTYGHKEGDIVLKKIGEVFTNTCRSTDIVSRNGGEEFSVILIDCPPETAIEIAERIRKNVESTPIELSNGLTLNITVSIGGASYPSHTSDLETLREKADMALYEAKRKGRNKVVFAS